MRPGEAAVRLPLQRGLDDLRAGRLVDGAELAIRRGVGYAAEADRNLVAIARLHRVEVASAIAAAVDEPGAAPAERLARRHVGLFRDGEDVVRCRLPPPHDQVEVSVTGDVVLSVRVLRPGTTPPRRQRPCSPGGEPNVPSSATSRRKNSDTVQSVTTRRRRDHRGSW